MARCAQLTARALLEKHVQHAARNSSSSRYTGAFLLYILITPRYPRPRRLACFQMLQALPWDIATILRAAAEGGVAISLAPLTDRLVVTPAIHQWAQSRLRALSK